VQSTPQEEPLTWERVFSKWQVQCDWINPSLKQPLEFLDVPISPPDADNIAPVVIEWWKAEEIARKTEALNIHGLGAVRLWGNWGKKPAYLDTATMLWRYRGDLAATAAILIAASLWNKEDMFRAEKGTWPSACRQVMNAVLDFLGTKEIPVWHHKVPTPFP